MKNDNTILWIIGIAIIFLVVTPQIDFKDIFAIVEYAPDSENLIYQVHENIKLIDGGCIIEQRNSGSLSTSLSCNLWLSREKFAGNLDFGISDVPFFWHKNGVEWRWIYEMTPGAGCLLRYYRGGLWTYSADVKLDNGNLIREVSDLYSYQDYNFNISTKQSYIEHMNPEWIMNGYCPLGVTTNEEGIEVIDDCGSFGVVDPLPFNGIDELKCDAYCIPFSKECIVRIDGKNESQICVADGSIIEHEICYSACEYGVCTISPFIEIPTIGDQEYGKDFNVTIRLLLGDEPLASNLIVGRIEFDGAPITETSGFTDDNGYVTLEFKKVEAVGFVSLVASTTIRGIEKQESTEIFFSGIPVNFEVTTESYVQSNEVNITFLVEVIDAKNRPVHLELVENLQAETSLSEGIILNNYVEYLGSGIYEVLSEVNGSGIFLGGISFNYQGEHFESPLIKLDVEYATISVGTSLIKPLAILGTTETITINFVSALGLPLDPDEITIRISLPTGYEKDILTMSDLTKVINGTYEFDYYFEEVEKYSFDIHASKEGYATGNAKATVSVTGEEGVFGPGPAFGFSNLKLIFYAAVVLIILFFIIKSGRRRGTVI